MNSKHDCRVLAQQCLQHYINNSSCENVDEVIKAIQEHLVIIFMTLFCAAKGNAKIYP
ncbi:hypothetical protein [Spartinivicinus poritis]|uniref:Uncharacterized protein n=1 Tax=Spartinivicinus poritis TaxID=2994640 RepID=A0ABT5UF67_9GAMM|nr:hypothetical protein [Spartinivicinus sp. A2-2]MDE1464113.1 hypothetical protein [Spartinivicinus sp. A2-2]